LGVDECKASKIAPKLRALIDHVQRVRDSRAASLHVSA